jgi:hypothetical protein
VTLVGINSNDAMWTPTADLPSGAVKQLEAKAWRSDCYLTNLTSGNIALNLARIVGWATTARMIGCQPILVLTWTNALVDTNAAIAAVQLLCAAIPGLWIEWGNEWESALMEGPTEARAEAYVAQFAAIVPAGKSADPTSKWSPSPVANIDVGWWGDTWTLYTLEAGLAAVPYDWHFVHAYTWPANVPPVQNGIVSHYLDIVPAIARWTSEGLKMPVGVTECGFQSSTAGDTNGLPEMTPALQSQYLLELLELPGFKSLPVLLVFTLCDSAGGTYGLCTWPKWPTGPQVLKPAYKTVKALWTPPKATT